MTGMRVALVFAVGVIFLGCPGSSPSDGGTDAGGADAGTDGGLLDGGAGGGAADGGAGFTCGAPIDVDLRLPDGGGAVFGALLASALDEAGRGVVAWSRGSTIEALRISAAGQVGARELVVPDAGGLGQWAAESLTAAANADRIALAWATTSPIFVSEATGPGWSTSAAADTSPYRAAGLQAALAPDGGVTLSWEINRSLAVENQPWVAQKRGGTWTTTPLTPGFTAWHTVTTSNRAGDFGGCYGDGWPPIQSVWFTWRADGTNAEGRFAQDTSTVTCGLGANGALAVAFGDYPPGGRFVVTDGDAGTVFALPGETLPLAVRAAAGHALLLSRSSGGPGMGDAVNLLTDDAGVSLIVPDAGISTVFISPVIDEDGTVFFVSTTNYERPEVTVLRPPAWNPVPRTAPFGARVSAERVAPFTSAWGGGRGVIAWREGARLFVSLCR